MNSSSVHESDKRVLAWLFSSVLSGIIYLIITAIAVYLKTSCWIFYGHQLAGADCMSEINIIAILAVPLGLGILTGSLFYKKMIPKNQDRQT